MPDKTENQFYYDERGLMTKREIGSNLPDKREIVIIYDELGRKEKQINPDGTSTRWKYDTSDNIIEISTWNKNGQLLRTDASTIYDIMNRPVKKLNAKEQLTLYEYDIMGRVTKITKADGTQIKNEYNAYGDLVKQTDEMGNITIKKYDLAGNVIQEIDAMGSQTTYKYDEAGNRTKTIDDKGNTWTVIYDALNRVKTIKKPSDKTALSPVFDVNNDGLLNEKDKEALNNM